MGIWKDVKGRFSKQPEEKVIKIGPHQYHEDQLKKMLGMGSGEAQINTPYASKKEEAKYKSEYKWLFNPNKGVRWDFNPIKIRSLAQDDTWVQMIIQNMTREISHTPGQIVENENPEVMKEYNPFERVSKGKEGTKAVKQQNAEKAKKLLKNPNPDEDQSDFITQAVADMLEVGSMTGIKMFAKSDYNGQELVSNDPTVIHVKTSMPETFTKEYQNKTGILDSFWQYDKNRGGNTNSRGHSSPTRFDTEEVMWADLNPRSNRRYGLPPTVPVEEFLELMDLTVSQEQRFWSRGALIAGFIASNGDAEEIEALKGETDSAKGKPEKQLLHVSDPDAKYQQVGVNWADMKMNEREEWYAKVIASEFGVPTSVVGLKPENVNRATFRAERGNFESNTLGPYMQKLERWINSQLIWPHFGRDIRWEFQPGMSENQKSSISERVTREWNSNLIKRSEAREQIGYENIEEDNQDGFKEDLVSEAPSPEDADQLSLAKYIRKQDDVFESIQEAERRAEELGLEGWHAIRVDGERMYVPGKNEERYNEVTGKSILGKPFGPWEDFEGCVQFMIEEEGHDEESAKRICGSLEAELKEDSKKKVECEKCGDSLPEDNKRFCSKSCYHEFLSKDEPLRETPEWDKFGFQPSDVEDLQEEIKGEVDSFFQNLAEHERFNELVEAGAKESKNSASLRRVLKDILKGAALSEGIEGIILEQTAEKAVESLEATASETGLSADKDAVRDRLENRNLEFADNYSKRIEEGIRDTVSEGWQEGKTTREIGEDIKEKSEDLSENQSRVIARDQLQRANGEARNSFAKQHSDKFVEEWIDSSDDRVRPAHQEMDGTWKYPSEDFIVEYEGRGTAKESFPGDSKYGIMCRCDTVLRKKEEVDSKDHRGE